MDNNTNAFLKTIATLESGNSYNVLCGGGTFSDYSTFPDWSGCNINGVMSHAAGAYQFQPATWAAIQKQLSLPDFSPASQDKAAAQLIINQGAQNAVFNGDTSTAVQQLASQWQSLSVNSLATINNDFTANGGALNTPGTTSIIDTVTGFFEQTTDVAGLSIDNTSLVIIGLVILLLLLGWVWYYFKRKK